MRYPQIGIVTHTKLTQGPGSPSCGLLIAIVPGGFTEENAHGLRSETALLIMAGKGELRARPTTLLVDIDAWAPSWRPQRNQRL